MTRALFGRYRIVVADTPWGYDNYGCKDHGAAKAHYSEMTTADIASMPVGSLAHPEGALLAFWCTGPKEAEGAHVEVAKGWGFELKTRLFTWAKCNDRCVECGHTWDEHRPGDVAGEVTRGRCVRVRQGHEPRCECATFVPSAFFGPGSYTGKGVESVWLATRGKTPWSSLRARKDVRELITHPIGAHSAKPEVMQDRLEALWPHVHPSEKLEMFARRVRPGWDCWGNELADPTPIFGVVPDVVTAGQWNPENFGAWTVAMNGGAR